MSEPAPPLSQDQWEFLAALEALSVPVSIELAGILAPLMPGPLFDLLGKAEPLGWIRRVGPDRFAIGPGLTREARARIESMNDSVRLLMFADRVIASGQWERIDPRIMVSLLSRAGREREAGEAELEAARRALETRDFVVAHSALQSALARLWAKEMDPDSAALFVSGALDLSSLSLSLGRGLPEWEDHLHRSQEAAALVGDQRSHALVALHLGRLYYFSGRRTEAIVAFAMGLDAVEELGDDDILTQADEFAGINFFMQGRFREALGHFERAESMVEHGKNAWRRNPTTPIFMGYCAMYLGQFHRAVGHLDTHWRQAMERSDRAFATTVRAVLGTVLVLLKKDREASWHLEVSIEEAVRDNNALALYLARGGTALWHFIQGQIGKAYEILKVAVIDGRAAGLVRQYASPWILEMVYEFHRLGLEPFPDFRFHEMVQRIRDEPNVHLRGVALRLQAREKIAHRGDEQSIWSDLAESEESLKLSGDTVQLSKTKLEAAKLALRSNDRTRASRLAQEAWHDLGGYADDFFPQEFKFLTEAGRPENRSERLGGDFLRQYLEMIGELLPVGDEDQILNKVVAATSRLLGGERGALFWFPDGKYTPRPQMRAASNLDKGDVEGPDFRPHMGTVLKAFRQNEPMVVRASQSGDLSSLPAVRSVLCIPVEGDGLVRSVLYLDNSYLTDAFDFLDASMLRHMARHTNLTIERLFDHMRLRREMQALVLEKTRHSEQTDREPIIAESPVMSALLEMADKVANSDSTVLILGETGTGKELLARHIHHKSGRHQGPLIVVDSTTIPENLVESELFGYEKGGLHWSGTAKNRAYRAGQQGDPVP